MNNKIFAHVCGEQGDLPYENAHLVLPLERMEEVCGCKPMPIEPKYLRLTKPIERLHNKMKCWMVVVRQHNNGEAGIDYMPKAELDDPTFSWRDAAEDYCCHTLEELYDYFSDKMSRYQFNKIVKAAREDLRGFEYERKKECVVEAVRSACIDYLEEKERPVAEGIIKEIADTYGLQSVQEKYWRLEEKRKVYGWVFNPHFYL